ncbi:Holliday junction branch migration protein RuvA [Bifidobacterium choloepi]|uniref:Holliday junction branch migration complex subunit RuvA n=1 Tax=Bifidobacterium choloepi TaxID=2614131 RepID=A0A6I5MXX4_9BIFI|nr:Holliday junction branch migration protein RuvA [Bifidobacterium choloepi]NEG69107.1 Holliday junction branch migration protein RuvA [Bifidobacterium choloepi]
MIGMLRGTVDSVDAACAIVDVAGVGYEVRMPAADLANLHAGADVKVYTSLAISQDAVTLFGFLSASSKRMFLQLQKVSGIGPKVALSLLSTLAPDRLSRAIADGDATALAKAPGLGKKGAQKIILELKGSIDLAELGRDDGKIPAAAPARAPEDTGRLQVVEGLMSLGWRQQDATAAVDGVIEANGIAVPLADDEVPHVLRLALTSLDRGQ